MLVIQTMLVNMVFHLPAIRRTVRPSTADIIAQRHYNSLEISLAHVNID